MNDQQAASVLNQTGSGKQQPSTPRHGTHGKSALYPSSSSVP